MIVSIVLPYVKIVHYRGFQKVGESKYCAYRWLAHYDRSRRSCGKTTKTIFGEPNHYDRNNTPTFAARGTFEILNEGEFHMSGGTITVKNGFGGDTYGDIY